MRRAQITFDFMIAVILILITVAGVVSVASGEQANAQTFDTAAKLKVFAVDLRDTVTKVYAVGGGYTVRKSLPIRLGDGDSVRVVLNSTTNRVEISAVVGGEGFRVYQRLQVPIYSTSSITLGPGDETFNVTAENVGGLVYVKVEG